MTTKIRIAAFALAIALVAVGYSAQAQLSPDNAVGPGVGGQVHAFAFDPDEAGVAYAGGDVCGVYRFDADVGRWNPWSAGLGFADLSWSYYVDDLLVLGSASGLDPERQGVYAATFGGIYFRGRDDAQWECMTPNLTYNVGFAEDRYFRGNLRIPFSSLAFDPTTKRLYAGAGHGRSRDDDIEGSDPYRKFYPSTLGGTSGQANEYSLWWCFLDVADPEFVADTATTHGQVRQIAIANYVNNGAAVNEVIYACDSGLWTAGDTHMALWSPLLANKSAQFDANTQSANPWGVVVGSDAKCYALTRQTTDSEEHYLAPGVWQYSLTADRTTEQWSAVLGDNSFWPHTVSNSNLTWEFFLAAAGGDISELSIVWNEQGGMDALYVGEGAAIAGGAYGVGGYCRFGIYDGATTRRWAHILRTENGEYNSANAIYVANWQAPSISEAPLQNVGWHSHFPSMRTLTPFVVAPGGNRMAGITLGIPIWTNDAGNSWENFYCTSSGSGAWTNRGLNLLCAGSSTFLPSGQLVIGALDYGVFVGTDSQNGAFEFYQDGTDATEPGWPSAIDVEVVGATDEIYMVDNVDRKDETIVVDTCDGNIWHWTGSAWHDVAGGLRDAIGCPSGDVSVTTQISDIAFMSPSRVFVAVARVEEVVVNGKLIDISHYYICEGNSESVDGPWTWTAALPLDATPVSVPSRHVNRIHCIPGTSTLLVAAKRKGACPGGLYSVDVDAPTWTISTWMEGPNVVDTPQEQLAQNVTAIATDKLGKYVYIGCGGADTPTAPGRGGVVRFQMSSDGTWVEDAILAGYGNIGSDDGDVFDVSNPTQFSFPGAAVHDWEFCTRVNDIEVDPNNPLVAYAAVGPGNWGYYHSKFGAWRVDAGGWTQVLGSGETGSGASTVGISPVDSDVLYVGSAGQEFFRFDIKSSLVPTVAGAASYPVLAGTGTAPAHAIAVAIIPADTTTIEVVIADLSSWGGSQREKLFDDGQAPDLEVGDGIFTSRRAVANFPAAGTVSVPVYVEASDHGYALKNVVVSVVASQEVPAVNVQAVYRVRAGSSDQSQVLAVNVSTPAASTRVTADLMAISGPSSLRLRDDGLGEDIKAGDGIFTSPRFAALMQNVGTHVASVTAEPMVGGTVTQSVNMFAIDAAAKFTSDREFEETARLGEALATGLSTRPYSSVYFRASPNDDESKSVMIATFDDNTTPPGIWGRDVQVGGGDGRFENRGFVPGGWLTEPMPDGSRGVCYADFDNDGDTDVFLCNPTYGGKLYVNHLTDTSCAPDWQGKFIDQTAEIFGADVTYLAGAITASWGDYTGDGFVDLFVATGTYTESMDELPMEAQAGGSGGDMRLFRNVMGTAMSKELIFGSGLSPICLAGCWLDLDVDGDLDLVTTRYSGGGLAVLENHGINPTHTGQLMEQVAWMPSVDNIGANSITVIDFNHDTHLDLLLTEDVALRKQAWVLRNNYDGTPGSKTFEAVGFGLGKSWNGAIVSDCNLDGQDDFVLLPKEADVVPAFYVSTGYAETLEFEEPWPAIQITGVPTTPIYRDFGYTLGIRDGRTGGGFAADLDGDHAPDLFLGRDMVGSQGQSSGEQCLYRSTGTAGATNHWLQVNLRTRGDSNGSLIGTTVQVVTSGKDLHKVVDGGSFRGGQGSNDLLFGLGSETSIEQVIVVFPSGETHTFSEPEVAVGTPNTIWEESMNVLTYPRQASALELQPGFVDWVFKWKTGTIKGDLRLDQLEIYPFGGSVEDAVTFQWGSPNVNNLVYRENGVWNHELRLVGLQCVEGMRWTFKVYSSAGVGGLTISAPTWASTAATTYCLPENYGQ